MRCELQLAPDRLSKVADWYRPAHRLGADVTIGWLGLLGGSALFLRPMWSLEDGTPKIIACWALLGIVAVGLLWRRFGSEWLTFLVRQMPAFVFVHLCALASVAWSLEPAHSAERAVWLLSTTMVGVCIGYSRNPKDVMAIVMWLFAFFVGASLLTIFLLPAVGQDAANRDVLIDHSVTGVWRGIFLNRNELGAIASGAALFFAVASLHGRVHLTVGVPLFLISVIMVVMSSSATALVLLILSMVTILILYISKKLKVASITFVLSLILVFPATLLVLENFDLLTRSLQRDATLTTRVDIWQDGLKVVEDGPLIGFGYRAVWLGDERTWFPNLQSTRGTGEAHNGYLQIAADLGLPAALAATAVVVGTAILAFRTYAGTGSAFAFFCFLYTIWFMTFNITETRLFQFRRLDWIIFVIVAVSLKRSMAGPIGRRRAH